MGGMRGGYRSFGPQGQLAKTAGIDAAVLGGLRRSAIKYGLAVSFVLHGVM